MLDMLGFTLLRTPEILGSQVTSAIYTRIQRRELQKISIALPSQSTSPALLLHISAASSDQLKENQGNLRAVGQNEAGRPRDS